MSTKTTRFMAELETAEEVMRVAEANGIELTIEQAHEAWAEHSDDYCASWLMWRDADTTSEILQALTKYRGKRPYMIKEKL